MDSVSELIVYQVVPPVRPIRAGMRLVFALGTAAIAAACGGADTTPTVNAGSPTPATAITAQVATVAIPFSLDASMHGAAFNDPKGRGLTYRITFSPSANGLAASGGQITGAPLAPSVITATVIARDVGGDSAVQTFPIVAFAAGLPAPSLPLQSFAYSDASAPLPPHFRVDDGNIGPAIGLDNSGSNPTTDAGATLGRVLFYDARLSANDQEACASCHQQAFGFSDTARFSRGFAGARTARHAMGLANARFYALGRFFWDMRAPTLEAQALMPIQDKGEMGMTLDNLVLKVRLTEYYAPLFQAAFGTPEVTSDRIARAIAQFVRSLVSSQSRFDAAFDANGKLDPSKLTSDEAQGRQLFVTSGCAACHATNAVVGDAPHNNGIDAVVGDTGFRGGQFKPPSLRNIAVRPPYMHDGRFQTLDQVVQFYDSGVQPNPGLDNRLRTPSGPKRLNLTQQQRDALVAYLRSLTDQTFLTALRFANPFGVNAR
jgi:cytochrome c peroxidase